MEMQEVIVRLKGLLSEHERRSEEVWAAGLNNGYGDAQNENGKTAHALTIAIKKLEETEVVDGV